MKHVILFSTDDTFFVIVWIIKLYDAIMIRHKIIKWHLVYQKHLLKGNWYHDSVIQNHDLSTSCLKILLYYQKKNLVSIDIRSIRNIILICLLVFILMMLLWNLWSFTLPKSLFLGSPIYDMTIELLQRLCLRWKDPIWEFLALLYNRIKVRCRNPVVMIILFAIHTFSCTWQILELGFDWINKIFSLPYRTLKYIINLVDEFMNE